MYVAKTNVYRDEDSAFAAKFGTEFHRRGAKKPARRRYIEDSSEDDADDEDDYKGQNSDMHNVGLAAQSEDTGANAMKRRASTASVESSLFIDAESEPAIEKCRHGSDCDADVTRS